jgi:transcriptional regulator with XRE-family HTH domain
VASLQFRNRERLEYTYKLKAELAAEIREECAKRGWGPSTLAKRFNSRHSEYSKILNGKHKGFSLDRLVMILYALDCRPKFVFEREIPGRTEDEVLVHHGLI